MVVTLTSRRLHNVAGTVLFLVFCLVLHKCGKYLKCSAFVKNLNVNVKCLKFKRIFILQNIIMLLASHFEPIAGSLNLLASKRKANNIYFAFILQVL